MHRVSLILGHKSLVACDGVHIFFNLIESKSFAFAAHASSLPLPKHAPLPASHPYVL
jgi:hypothetical protein